MRPEILDTEICFADLYESLAVSKVARRWRFAISSTVSISGTRSNEMNPMKRSGRSGRCRESRVIEIDEVLDATIASRLHHRA